MALDWKTDAFLSEWDKKYVSTNLSPNARPFQSDFFSTVHSELASTSLELAQNAPGIIAAVCCAVGRADVVGKYFGLITESATPEKSEKLFLRLRESITIVFPYLGMPTCMPACYGMIGVVQRKGGEYASTKVLRKPTIDEEDVRKGKELRSRIYSGVGNSDIFALMDKYFADLFTTSTVVTWGYLIAKANEEVFQPEESHLIIAAAIMALGATRQTKSHIKATLGIGNSVETVKAVVDAVQKIASWANRSVAAVDVDALSVEIKAALSG